MPVTFRITTAVAVLGIGALFACAEAQPEPLTAERLAGMWALDCQRNPRSEWGRWTVMGDTVQFDYGTFRSTERVTSIEGNTITTAMVWTTVEGVRAGDRFSYALDGRRARVTDHARNIVEILERCS